MEMSLGTSDLAMIIPRLASMLLEGQAALTA